MTLPREYSNHEFVRRRAYYWLPDNLLLALSRELGEDALDPCLLKMESTISKTLGSFLIGYWREEPVNYDLLRRAPAIRLTPELIKGWGTPLEQVQEQFDAEEPVLDGLREATKGYCGWLLTNPQFITEHDRLFTTHADTIMEYGIPGISGAATGPPPDELKVDDSPPLTALCEACDSFYVKWRLLSLIAPNLPRPAGPHFPTPSTVLALGRKNEFGEPFYVPETLPIPSEDVFRKLVENAVRHSKPPEHLQEWMAWVRNDNPAKNRIARFGRIFEIQHYCRVVFERHSNTMRRGIGKLTQALATFFEVSPDTIKNDLAEIRGRLGEDWMHRGNKI